MNKGISEFTMPELKFRAYDGLLKKFVYFDIWSVFHCANDMKSSIRQYLGFKDANGVEVYYGDRIKHAKTGETTVANWSLAADIERKIIGAETITVI